MDKTNRITRRAALVGAAGSSLAVVTSAVATGESNQDRINRLSRELAAALAEPDVHFDEVTVTARGALHTRSDDQDAAILAAYREWVQVFEAFANSPADGEDEPLYQALSAAETKVVNIRPHTARGLAIQFLVFTNFGEFEATSSSTHNFEGAMLRIAGVSAPTGHPLTYMKMRAA